MKRSISLFLFLIFMLPAGGAQALTSLTQNEFTTAESLDPGMTQAGMQFTLGKNYKSYYPVIRYGLGGLMEVGVKFGATTVEIHPEWWDLPGMLKGPEDKLVALVGADLKYQLVKETEGVPLDMAVDLGFDTLFISGRTASELTFSTIFSKNFPLTERGYKFTPYGGLEISSRYGSYANLKDETNFYVFGGLEWKLSQKFMFLMEIKTGENALGGVGIRFEY